MLEKTPAQADASEAATEDFVPFERIDGDYGCGLLLLCDHASNRLPASYGDLGLRAEEFRRHIAYDIGAAPLTRLLAARLGAPAVLSCYSRLLIDPNRGEDDPTLVMKLSDGAVVPGNARIEASERDRRVELYYRPYHDAVADAVRQALASGRVPAVLSMHSFTPAWKSVPRPWHAGILWDIDPRLAVPLIRELAADAELVVGDNEPYSGALRNDTLYRHATLNGLANAVLEVRQDLIGGEEGVTEWADRLEPIIRRLVDDPAVGRLQQFGSRADL